MELLIKLYLSNIYSRKKRVFVASINLVLPESKKLLLYLFKEAVFL